MKKQTPNEQKLEQENESLKEQLQKIVAILLPDEKPESKSKSIHLNRR